MMMGVGTQSSSGLGAKLWYLLIVIFLVVMTLMGKRL